MGKETALPKNIRQIGDIQGKERICIEDYVMTYIRKKEKQEEQGCLGIFLGEQQEVDDFVYVFIRGIFELPDMGAAGKDGAEQETEEKRQERWESWRQECVKHFPDWTVQGCCVIGRYQTERMKELAGLLPEAGKLIYHLQEQEETIYWTDESQYRRIKGYFVFYEQNRRMQEYLAEVFKEDSVEKESLPDKAIKSFREKVKEKGEKRSSSFLKLASSFFVVTVLAIGAIVVNRVEDIRMVRNALDTQGNTAENEAWQVSQGSKTVQTKEAGGVNGTSDADAQVSASDAGAEQDNLAGSSAFWEDDLSDTDGTLISAANLADGTEAGKDDLSVGAAAGIEESAGNSADTSADTGAADAGSGAVSGSTGVSTDAGSGAVLGSTGVSADTGTTADSAAATSTASAADGGEAASDSAVDSSADTPGSAVADADTASTANRVSSDAGTAASIPGFGGGADADGEVSEAAVRQTRSAYVIKEGDTLADICKKYYGNIDRLSEICETNGIADANMILPGQKIVLP